jgi:hypothetical protein
MKPTASTAANVQKTPYLTTSDDRDETVIKTTITTAR